MLIRLKTLSTKDIQRKNTDEALGGGENSDWGFKNRYDLLEARAFPWAGTFRIKEKWKTCSLVLRVEAKPVFCPPCVVTHIVMLSEYGLQLQILVRKQLFSCESGRPQLWISRLRWTKMMICSLKWRSDTSEILAAETWSVAVGWGHSGRGGASEPPRKSDGRPQGLQAEAGWDTEWRARPAPWVRRHVSSTLGSVCQVFFLWLLCLNNITLFWTCRSVVCWCFKEIT